MRAYSPKLCSSSKSAASSSDIDPELTAKSSYPILLDADQMDFSHALSVHHTSSGQLIGIPILPIDVLRNARRSSADQRKKMDPFMHRSDWQAQARHMTTVGGRPMTAGSLVVCSPLSPSKPHPGQTRPSTARPASPSKDTLPQTSFLRPSASVHSCPSSPATVKHITGLSVPGGHFKMTQGDQHKGITDPPTSPSQQTSQIHTSGRHSVAKSRTSRGLAPQPPFQLSLGYHQPLKLMMDQQGNVSERVNELMLLSQQSSGVDKRIDEYRCGSL
jgi:hypothetical protein